MSAYAETYLPRAMKNMGEAFDYALTAMGVPAADLQRRLSDSPLTAEWEEGSARVLVGLSGTEFAQGLFPEREPYPPPQRAYDLNRAYWAGWALAYSQWRGARRFADILAAVPLDEVIEMYSPLHEASEDRFADEIDTLIHERTHR